ncbi:uncharacterized protein [Haliotis asinina]|uniref:uncharacterized protein n=1 Tax=Haliotis asinina TaxID=109174 RepID=UPI00353223F6
MPQRQHLSIEERARAIGWLNEGVSQREAARRLNVRPPVINRLRQRYLQTQTVRDRQRSGRPRVTTGREDRLVVLEALRRRTVTASHLRQLRTATGTIVSEKTIMNRLRERNLRPRRQAVRPRLLPRHRVARDALARHHLHWTRQQWSGVLCSDESRFSLQHNDGRVLVDRRPGERFADVNVRGRGPGEDEMGDEDEEEGGREGRRGRWGGEDEKEDEDEDEDEGVDDREDAKGDEHEEQGDD